MSDITIYVKNPTQKNKLKQKHKEVNAEWIDMKGATGGIDDSLPMVCMEKNGKDICEVGEEYIDIFSKEASK